MKVEKSAIRQRILAQRRALPPVALAAAGEAVFNALRSMAEYWTAGAVVSYVAHDNEVPTGHVLRDVNRSGRLVYLPLTKGAPGFRSWQSNAAWTKGIGGVPELIGQPEPLPDCPTVILLPLVGWSEEGGRLGRGGGFYDRMLASKTEQAVLIGLAYEFQKVPAMPSEPICPTSTTSPSIVVPRKHRTAERGKNTSVMTPLTS